MDGGHFIPKGHSSRWALEEENVHPQCKDCNGFQMRYGTASQAYTLWMVEHYGKDFVEYMLKTKRETLKLYKSDYIEMIDDFKKQIKEHLKRIGDKP